MGDFRRGRKITMSDKLLKRIFAGNDGFGRRVVS
jgi:hypothetical protein